MKAIRIHAHGGVGTFRFEELPRPQVAPGEVLVAVKATSVNPIDTKVRGRALPFSPPLPAVLHADFAGVVVELGEGVTEFRLGDAVYGCAGGIRGTRWGALSDFMPVDADLIARMPANLDFAQAAALPLVSLTAWEALVEKLNVQPGSRLLVHGGVGGVGHIAAQLGKHLGAIVHTTVSSQEDVVVSEKFGAHFAINYTTTSPDEYIERYTDGRGFDYVFDTVGGGNLQNSFKATKLNGAVACSATGGNYDLTPLYVKGLSLMSVLMLIPLFTGQDRKRHGGILRRITSLVEDQAIRPLLHPTSFAWHDIAKAHELLESGKHKGKIVVTLN